MRELMAKGRYIIVLGSVWLLGACSTIVAENSCGTTDLDAHQMQQAFTMGKGLESALNALKNDVVIVARSGQDLEKYGIRYSHVAFMVKEQQKWQVYHLLNECPSSFGGLYQEGLGSFVMPAMMNVQLKNGSDSVNAQAMTFGFAIPPKAIQGDLKRLLQDPVARKQVFERQYSAVAHPYTLINQNSNGWVLEAYSIAEAQQNKQKINHRKAAQDWLKSQGYQGSELPASIVKQRLAALFVGNVSLKGHDQSDRYQGKLLINSGDSVLNYISRNADTINCARLPNSAAVKDANYCELTLR